MPKSFPCPYCKGVGEWVEAVLDDGSGPTVQCGWCQGAGMIEIDGPIHKEMKAQNKSKDELWEMIAEKDYALCQVIDALKTIGVNHFCTDGWSEAPRLLDVCLKARSFPREPEIAPAISMHDVP